MNEPKVQFQIKPKLQFNSALLDKIRITGDFIRNQTIKTVARKRQSPVMEYLENLIDNFYSVKFGGEFEGTTIVEEYKLIKFIKNQYDIFELYKGIKKSNGEKVMIKVMQNRICGHILKVKNLVEKYRVLMNFQSPYVRKILHVHVQQNEKKNWNELENIIVYVVFESISNEFTPLSTILNKIGNYTEEKAKHIFFKIAIALNHLHLSDIVHGDINCKNIYINNKDEIIIASLGVGFSDFGIEKGYIGNFNYYPLEMFKGESLDKSTDIFSLGVVLYVMLCGYAPINAEHVNEYSTRLENRKNINFNHKELWDISFECKGLIMELMHKDPDARPQSIEVIYSSWLREEEKVYSSSTISVDTMRKYIQKMQSCVSMDSLKRVILRVVSRKARCLNKQEVENIFYQFDRSYRNFFDIDEFKMRVAELGMENDVNCENAFYAVDVNKNNKIEYDEFVSLMTDYELISIIDAFIILLREVDHERNGDIEANELYLIFKKYDVSIDYRSLMEIFPEGKTKVKYEYLASVYWSIFFPGSYDEPYKQHEDYAEQLQLHIEILLCDCLKKVSKKVEIINVRKVDDSTKLSKNDSKNKAMREYITWVWTRINSKLPYKKTPEQRKDRIKLFAKFDISRNGYLDYAEVENGIRNILGLSEDFITKPVVMNAFENARKLSSMHSNVEMKRYADKFIEISEFRILLQFLRQYIEYWVMFEKIDSSGDMRLSRDEFHRALGTIREWGINLEEEKADDTYNAISKNSQAPFITFEDFIVWATSNNLDLDDDVE